MNDPGLHADLSLPALVDSKALPWQPAPGGQVWRKRFYLDGPAEAGKVTSLVRYEPDSRFHTHHHPGGEEILVLEGTFSDEHGDWPAGSYLLNPEGFRHQPFSQAGCLIFVRLRQYEGKDRENVALTYTTLPWQADSTTGIRQKPLYQQAGFSDRTSLIEIPAGEHLMLSPGAEVFLIEGQVEVDGDEYGAHSWLRASTRTSLGVSVIQRVTALIRGESFQQQKSAMQS